MRARSAWTSERHLRWGPQRENAISPKLVDTFTFATRFPAEKERLAQFKAEYEAKGYRTAVTERWITRGRPERGHKLSIYKV